MKKYMAEVAVPLVVSGSLFSLTACGLGGGPCEGAWHEFESDGVTYCARMDAEREARCPAGFSDRATDDWKVVVCDDTDGGDAEESVAAAHEYFGETCAAMTSAGECAPPRSPGRRRGCEWVPPERHAVFESGTCSAAEEGVCLFVSAYYGDEVPCLERETEGGRQVITLTEGYEYTPGWGSSDLCRDECADEMWR